MYTLVFSCAAYIGLSYLKLPVTSVHDKFFSIAATATVFSYLAVVFFYIKVCNLCFLFYISWENE